MLDYKENMKCFKGGGMLEACTLSGQSDPAGDSGSNAAFDVLFQYFMERTFVNTIC